jgi:signal transduction histidine kinase
MKRRATELGGRLAVADAHPGTSVVLWLPLARDGAGSDGNAA